METEIGYFKQGGVERVKLDSPGDSQVFFVCTLSMFWVGGVVHDGAWYPVGVLHDPADDKMVKVI